LGGGCGDRDLLRLSCPRNHQEGGTASEQRHERTTINLSVLLGANLICLFGHYDLPVLRFVGKYYL